MVWYRDWSRKLFTRQKMLANLRACILYRALSTHVSFPRPEPSSRLVPGNETGYIHYLSVSLSLLLKVCQTLKNRARNVRDIARDTLVKMAAALGPRYLPYIIREMKELLTRGYQVNGRNLGGWEGEGGG